MKVSLEAAGCHNACKHCYNSQGGPARDFLSVEEVLSVREAVADLGVSFDFGFPNGHMIHSGWRTLWPVMHDQICCGQINGCRLVEDRDYQTTVAEMKAMGLKRVQLAFYGVEQTHNRFANSDDAYDYDIGAARRFIECGIPLEQVQVVCHRKNLGEIEEIIQFAKELQRSDTLIGGELMLPALSGRWACNQDQRVTREEYYTLSEGTRELPHWQNLATEGEWIQQVHDASLSPSTWMQEQIEKRSQEVHLYIDRHMTVWDDSDQVIRRRLGVFSRESLPVIVEAYQAYVDINWQVLAEMDDAKIVEQYAVDTNTVLNTKKDVLISWLIRCRERD